MKTLLNYEDFLTEAVQIQHFPEELREAISIAKSAKKPIPEFIEFLNGPYALKFSSSPYRLVSTPSQIKNGTFVFTIPGASHSIALFRQGYIRKIPQVGVRGQPTILAGMAELVSMFFPDRTEDQSMEMDSAPREGGKSLKTGLEDIDSIIYEAMAKFIDVKLDPASTVTNFPKFIRMKGRSQHKPKDPTDNITINVIDRQGNVIRPIEASLQRSSQTPYIIIQGKPVNLEGSIWSPDVFKVLNISFYTRSTGISSLNDSVLGAKDFVEINGEFLAQDCDISANNVSLKLDPGSSISGSTISCKEFDITLDRSSGEGINVSSENFTLNLRNDSSIRGASFTGKMNVLMLEAGRKNTIEALDTLGDRVSRCKYVAITTENLDNTSLDVSAATTLHLDMKQGLTKGLTVKANPKKIRNLWLRNIRLSESPDLVKAAIMMMSKGPSQTISDWMNEGVSNYHMTGCDFTGVDLSGLVPDPNGVEWTEKALTRFIDSNTGIRLDPNSESPLIRRVAKSTRGASMFGV